MIAKMMVRGERADSYMGKKGQINSVVLALDDMDNTDQRMLNSLDYTMSDEEKVAHAGKLQGKVLTMGFRDFTIFGGRIRARGKIVEVGK